VSELVGGQEVEAVVAEVGGGAGDRVEGPLDLGSDALLGVAATGRTGVGCAARARSKRWARSASLSWSAPASAPSTLSETPFMSPRQLPAADATLDPAILDSIDEIVRPGVNLNPADTSYGELVLKPPLRRR
jgi:hypothetical protein